MYNSARFEVDPAPAAWLKNWTLISQIFALYFGLTYAKVPAKCNAAS